MPIPATAQLPPPRSEDELDDMVADAIAIRFGTPGAVRFGRRGQSQHGIDGIDLTLPLNKTIVWQSTLQRERLVEKIEADLAQLETGFGTLPRLFVAALGTNRDAALQARFLELTERRLRQDKCSVLLLFWEDIRSDLCSKDEIARKWFPTLFTSATAPTGPETGKQSDDTAYWESRIARMIADWQNWCFDSRYLSLMSRVPIVRIVRSGVRTVEGIPELGCWNIRTSGFVPNGNGGADTVRVGGIVVRLSTITDCEDVTPQYMTRLLRAG